MANSLASAISLLAALLVGGSALAAAGEVYPNLAAFPGDIPKKAGWYQQCLRLRPEQAPRRDTAFASEAPALKSCNANDLYYDARSVTAATNADWEKVRDCAFASNDTGVLTMLYANGKGVAKNLKLATKFACSTESAIAEMAGRVNNLTRRMTISQGADFDICEDVSSGYMQGICALIDERQQEKRRNARLTAIVRKWPTKDQVAFRTLSNALNTFAQHRAEDETDLSGSARKAQEVDALSAELDQFAADIESFEAGKLPAYTSSEFNGLNQRLNDAYRSFMKIPHLDAALVGSIKQEDVQKTQQAWLGYRNAMVAFGTTRYPTVTAISWNALLTERRARQLAEFAEAAVHE